MDNEKIGYHRLCAMNEIMKNTKIDDGKGRKNKSDKEIPINMESIETIAKHMKQEVDDLYKNK